jgi:hypothetical protein
VSREKFVKKSTIVDHMTGIATKAMRRVAAQGFNGCSESPYRQAVLSKGRSVSGHAPVG